MNPDRKARFEFVMPALSDRPETRDAFFQSLADVKNRRREPWVVEGVSYLNHPLRGAQVGGVCAAGTRAAAGDPAHGRYLLSEELDGRDAERSQQPSFRGHRADVSRRASGCSRFVSAASFSNPPTRCSGHPAGLCSRRREADQARPTASICVVISRVLLRCPHRPEAQDVALSRPKHGFESRWGRHLIFSVVSAR